MQPYFILFKFATRSRPQKALESINNILNNISDKINYQIFLTLDKDDSSMNNLEIKTKLLKLVEQYNIQFHFDDSKNKIDAMNRDMNLVNQHWDIMVTMSDDMVFQYKGFDDIIRKVFTESFNDLDGCPHFFDGYRNDLITLSVVGRKYFDRFNYVYNPEYISFYADDEQKAVAKILDKYKFIEYPIIVKHEHPNNNQTVFMDKQYIETEQYYGIDGNTFSRRKKLNFNL